jgi:glyoxylase-like metal-dependent hydrolase (beta-lactamase superfamily II)
MKVKQLIVGILETNCYIAYHKETKEGFCIDPGGNASSIIEFLKKEKIKIQGVLLTHGHFDHINALEEVKKYTQAKVYISEKEKLLLLDPEKNLSLKFGQNLSFTVDQYLKNEEIVRIGNYSIQLLETPGHTQGSVCYYMKKENVLFSGDTLFANSVGRTDLPTGNMEHLCNSIKKILFLLPDETKVYPGHGEVTKIEIEKKYNTFC